METTAPIRIPSGRLHAAITALCAIELPHQSETLRNAALEVADIVRLLDADDDVVVAAMIQPLLDAATKYGTLSRPMSASDLIYSARK